MTILYRSLKDQSKECKELSNNRETRKPLGPGYERPDLRWGRSGWVEMPIPLVSTNRIRGNAINDIWVVGDFGFVAHFNGLSWRTYPEAALNQGNYESVDVLDNIMIAVGWEGSRAVVLTGRR